MTETKETKRANVLELLRQVEAKAGLARTLAAGDAWDKATSVLIDLRHEATVAKQDIADLMVKK